MHTALFLAQTTELPPSPSPLTQGAEEIFTLGQEASETIAASFDQLWINVLNGGLYGAVADIGSIIAVFALGLFLIQWAQAMLNGEEGRAIPDLIWPLLVIIFLSNDGALLHAGILDLRTIGNQINGTILEMAVDGASLQQGYQQARLGSAIDDALAASTAECLENRPERQQPACLAAARDEAQRLRQQYGLEPVEEYSWFGGVIQFAIRNLFYAFHSAFQWGIELVLLVSALLAPLAMGISLLPTPARPIIAWVSGFAGVFLIKLNFNLISGLAAYAVSLQEVSTESLLLPVLLGVLAPILAIVIGLQGGTTLFNALSTAAIYTGIRWLPSMTTAPLFCSGKSILRRLSR